MPVTYTINVVYMRSKALARGPVTLSMVEAIQTPGCAAQRFYTVDSYELRRSQIGETRWLIG